MTEEAIRNWINSNVKNKISEQVMRQALQMLLDNCAHKDNPLQPYDDTISNAELDGNRQVTINHSLDTVAPDFIMFDENGIQVFSECFTLQVIDYNNVQLTFAEAIPTSGNGYYGFSIWKVIRDIPIRYATVFETNFDDDTGLEIETLNNGSYQFNNGVLEITNDGSPTVFFTFTNFSTEGGKNYRVTINITQGDVRFNFGNRLHVLPEPGEHQFLASAIGSGSYISSFSSDTTFIDSLKIEEEA